MNKYYTPTQDEFYIGFEFEIGNKATKGESTKWEKDSKTELWMLKNIGEYEEIRVKYLDRKDIEELGFIYDEDLPNNYVKGNLDLLHIPIKNFIKIDDADGDPVYFQGKIKNKSELKKLLKQLNIQ